MENGKIAADVTVGNWSTYSTNISDEAMNVFKKAIDGLVGVRYTPFAVATQLVAGKNYRFTCNTQGLYVEAPNKLALVQIFQPLLKGDPHVTSIKIVE